MLSSLVGLSDGALATAAPTLVWASFDLMNRADRGVEALLDDGRVDDVGEVACAHQHRREERDAAHLSGAEPAIEVADLLARHEPRLRHATAETEKGLAWGNIVQPQAQALVMFAQFDAQPGAPSAGRENACVSGLVDQVAFADMKRQRDGTIGVAPPNDHAHDAVAALHRGADQQSEVPGEGRLAFDIADFDPLIPKRLGLTYRRASATEANRQIRADDVGRMQIEDASPDEGVAHQFTGALAQDRQRPRERGVGRTLAAPERSRAAAILCGVIPPHRIECLPRLMATESRRRCEIADRLVEQVHGQSRSNWVMAVRLGASGPATSSSISARISFISASERYSTTRRVSPEPYSTRRAPVLIAFFKASISACVQAMAHQFAPRPPSQSSAGAGGGVSVSG
jgi:hypothetical protein